MDDIYGCDGLNEKVAYCHEMIKRNRFISLRYDNTLHGLLTFFIGDSKEDKFITKDAWKVVDDDSTGDTCYIDLLLTDKEPKNIKVSYMTWKFIKEHIKNSFPNVKKFRWNRWKNNRLNIHNGYFNKGDKDEERIQIAVS